jgi:ABC-type lipoprotein release transport system permease subunit
VIGIVASAAEALDLGIAAIASPAVELVASDLLLVSEGDYRALFGAEPGRFTDVAVAVPNPDEVTSLAGKIVRMFPDARVVTRAELIRTYDAVLDWRSGLAAAVLAGAVLAFAILAWDRASGLSAEERHELGILKALGWDTRDVLAAKAWEGAAVSVSAFAVGALAAYAHVALGGAVLLRPILEGWAALYPDLRPAPPVDPLALGTLFFLTVIPYVAATVVPCWRAATVDPDALMRGDA